MRLMHLITVTAIGVLALACSKPAESPELTKSPKAEVPIEPASTPPAAARKLTLTYFTMPR